MNLVKILMGITFTSKSLLLFLSQQTLGFVESNRALSFSVGAKRRAVLIHRNTSHFDYDKNSKIINF